MTEENTLKDLNQKVNIKELIKQRVILKQKIDKINNGELSDLKREVSMIDSTIEEFLISHGITSIANPGYNVTLKDQTSVKVSDVSRALAFAIKNPQITKLDFINKNAFMELVDKGGGFDSQKEGIEIKSFTKASFSKNSKKEEVDI